MAPEDHISKTDELVDNNRNVAGSLSRPGMSSIPKLGVMIVACMDCRLDVPAVLGLRPGDAHVVRNAGGVLTDDVVRSVVISQRRLGTREIVLIHHTDCGMAGLDGAALLDEIERDAGRRPGWDVGAFADVHDDVRTSIRRLRDDPFLVHRDHIRGFVYDVDTALLTEVALQD